jgi:hypothetical protein
MGSANLAVSIAPKVVRTQSVDGYQDDGCGMAGTGESSQKAKQQPFPESSKATSQNWNRNEKLMTLELEDPLR